MEVLRTPDERFADLPDWPYEPHYSEVGAAGGPALRMARVDEGARDARPVLLLHGEPSWSYLYRGVIPPLLAAGHRVVAPDLIGFGRSDKPVPRSAYTYEGHVAWLLQWFDELALNDVTLFCQDWGGLLGLRLVAARPERFSGVVVANTGLPVGKPVGEGFMQWLAYSQSTPDLPIGQIVSMGTAHGLNAAVRAAYDAPFPSASYKAGACQFPTLVPITPTHGSVPENLAAWAELMKFGKPLVTAFSDQDPVTRGGADVFQARVPGAAGQPHVTLSGGHFLQEDCPADVAAVLLELMSRTAR